MQRERESALSEQLGKLLLEKALRSWWLRHDRAHAPTPRSVSPPNIADELMEEVRKRMQTQPAKSSEAGAAFRSKKPLKSRRQPKTQRQVRLEGEAAADGGADGGGGALAVPSGSAPAPASDAPKAEVPKADVPARAAKKKKTARVVGAAPAAESDSPRVAPAKGSGASKSKTARCSAGVERTRPWDEWAKPAQPDPVVALQAQIRKLQAEVEVHQERAVERGGIGRRVGPSMRGYKPPPKLEGKPAFDAEVELRRLREELHGHRDELHKCERMALHTAHGGRGPAHAAHGQTRLERPVQHSTREKRARAARATRATRATRTLGHARACECATRVLLRRA
eukprot:2778626-Prymnesium_polylepis.1